MEKNEALNRLTTLEFTFATIQADIENVAVQARVAGATWEEIGHRLGLSKQTTHARYNEAVKNERKTRYAAADAAGQYTAEEHAKAAEAMEILTTIADRQDAAAASLAQSKILDTEVAGESVTPSIFSDAPTSDPIHAGITDTSGDVIDWTGRRQFKNPKKCPFCAATNHYDRRAGHWWIYPDCTITDADYTNHDKEATK